MLNLNSLQDVIAAIKEGEISEYLFTPKSETPSLAELIKTINLSGLTARKVKFPSQQWGIFIEAEAFSPSLEVKTEAILIKQGGKSKAIAEIAAQLNVSIAEPSDFLGMPTWNASSPPSNKPLFLDELNSGMPFDLLQEAIEKRKQKKHFEEQKDLGCTCCPTHFVKVVLKTRIHQNRCELSNSECGED